jgi:hypothetical protein
MIFNRTFNSPDSRRLPDFVFCSGRPAGAVPGVAGGCPGCGGRAGDARGGRSDLHHGSPNARRHAQPPPAVGGPGRLLTAGAAGALPALFGQSAVPRVVEEIRFILDFRGLRAASSDPGRSQETGISHLPACKSWRASVILIVVESYGMSGFRSAACSHGAAAARRPRPSCALPDSKWFPAI